MQRDKVDDDCSKLAFDFFYWFSRFEFALKENKYLKSKKLGARAEPGWHEFIEDWQSKYIPSAEALELVTFAPQEQVIGVNGALEWRPAQIDDSKSELAKVISILRTVRNNLFHGGKHGVDGWDEPERILVLVRLGTVILNQLSQLGEFEADYFRQY